MARRKKKRKRDSIEADVHLMESMGFDENLARDTLLQNNGNLQDAISIILNRKREEADFIIGLRPKRRKIKPILDLLSGSDTEESKFEEDHQNLGSEDKENHTSAYDKTMSKARVDELVKNYESEKKSYQIEREKILNDRNKIVGKTRWLEAQSKRFRCVRCSDKWPENGDKDLLWLTEQWMKEEKLINTELNDYQGRLINFEEKLVNIDRSFQERTMEFENEKMVTELVSKEMERGLRLSVADRNVLLLSSAGKKIEEIYTCSICYCEYAVNEFAILDCLHGFCQSCLKTLIQTKVKEGTWHNLCCPNVDDERKNCKHHLTQEEVRMLIGEAKLFEKYEKLQLFQTLNQTKDCRWCPKPGCEMAMFGDKSTPMMTCPKCGLKFCFNCKTSEWHEGSTCIQFQKWKKENSGSETKFENWKKLNAKPCPNCSASIQKNGGCVHMTCTNCKYEFDWLSLESWKVSKKQRRRDRQSYRRRRHQRNRVRDIDSN